MRSFCQQVTGEEPPLPPPIQPLFDAHARQAAAEAVGVKGAKVGVEVPLLRQARALPYARLSWEQRVAERTSRALPYRQVLHECVPCEPVHRPRSRAVVLLLEWREPLHADVQRPGVGWVEEHQNGHHRALPCAQQLCGDGSSRLLHPRLHSLRLQQGILLQVEEISRPEAEGKRLTVVPVLTSEHLER
jgi:hypothetical protein